MILVEIKNNQSEPWLRYQVKLWSSQCYECNFSNCLEKHEKFRNLMGFEPVTSRCWWDALTNWAMKPQMVGAGHLWVQMFLWWMNQWIKLCMKWIMYVSFHIYCIILFCYWGNFTWLNFRCWMCCTNRPFPGGNLIKILARFLIRFLLRSYLTS